MGVGFVGLSFLVLVFFGILSAQIFANAQQDAPSSTEGKIMPKLEEILDRQKKIQDSLEQVLSNQDEIKKELYVVKIRATVS